MVSYYQSELINSDLFPTLPHFQHLNVSAFHRTNEHRSSRALNEWPLEQESNLVVDCFLDYKVEQETRKNKIQLQIKIAPVDSWGGGATCAGRLVGAAI